MHDCKPVSNPFPVGTRLPLEQCPKIGDEFEEMYKVPYASAVGGLMYVMVCTRPDIGQAVGVLSRFMANPHKEHWTNVKRVFRYLCGTYNHCICYCGSYDMSRVIDLQGFIDLDFVGDLDCRRSTSGYVFTLFGVVSWMSKRQPRVALSTTKVEYMAVANACK